MSCQKPAERRSCGRRRGGHTPMVA
jgi:hypothetical protein